MIRPLTAMWIVFAKEVRENLRDRRTVLNSLVVGPFLGPVLFAMMFSVIVNRDVERREQPLQIVIVGQEHAPNLIAFLAQRNVTPKQRIPADLETAIRDQSEDLILRIPPEFGERWRTGRPAPVEMLFDPTRAFNTTTVRRVEQILEGYGRAFGSLRLTARGIAPEVIQAVQVVQRDLSTPKNRAATILGMLPYFLIIGSFVGGMYLAIDTTAGERERQSLEALLINAVPRAAILVGKLTATTAFALLSLALTILAFAIALPLIPAQRIGIDLHVSPLTGLMLLGCIAPLAFLAAAIQTLFAAFSKTFREAQTWLGMFMILPMIPSVVMVINPIKPTAWMYASPLVSQQVVITHLMRGEAITAWQYAASIGVTLAAGVLVSLLAIRVYHSERLAISA